MLVDHLFFFPPPSLKPASLSSSLARTPEQSCSTRYDLIQRIRVSLFNPRLSRTYDLLPSSLFLPGPVVALKIRPFPPSVPCPFQSCSVALDAPSPNQIVETLVVQFQKSANPESQTEIQTSVTATQVIAGFQPKVFG